MHLANSVGLIPYQAKWEHLGELRTAGGAPNLDQSDLIVGRAISMLIKLSWQPGDLDRLTAGIDNVFGR